MNKHAMKDAGLAITCALLIGGGAAAAADASAKTHKAAKTESESAGALPSNITPGWKIRVCSERTKASSISFKIIDEDKGNKPASAASAPADSAGRGTEETTTWSQGDPTMIPLRSGISEAQKIRVEASPSQKDKDASVCLIYNDHVAKKMKFDEREVSTIERSDNGECGC